MGEHEEVTDQQRIENIIDITYELHSREVSNNILHERFSGTSWNDMCILGAAEFMKLNNDNAVRESLFEKSDFEDDLLGACFEKMNNGISENRDKDGINLWYSWNVQEIIKRAFEELVKEYDVVIVKRKP